MCQKACVRYKSIPRRWNLLGLSLALALCEIAQGLCRSHVVGYNLYFAWSWFLINIFECRYLVILAWIGSIFTTIECEYNRLQGRKVLVAFIPNKFLKLESPRKWYGFFLHSQNSFTYLTFLGRHANSGERRHPLASRDSRKYCYKTALRYHH